MLLQFACVHHYDLVSDNKFVNICTTLANLFHVNMYETVDAYFCWPFTSAIKQLNLVSHFISPMKNDNCSKYLLRFKGLPKNIGKTKNCRSKIWNADVGQKKNLKIANKLEFHVKIIRIINRHIWSEWIVQSPGCHQSHCTFSIVFCFSPQYTHVTKSFNSNQWIIKVLRVT